MELSCPLYLAVLTGVTSGQAAGRPGLHSCRLEGVRCHLCPATPFSWIHTGKTSDSPAATLEGSRSMR